MLTPENGNVNDPEKIASSKCYDIDEMHNIVEISYKNKLLSLFHIRLHSQKCLVQSGHLTDTHQSEKF